MNSFKFSKQTLLVLAICLPCYVFGCEAPAAQNGKKDSQAVGQEAEYALADFIEGIKEGPRTKLLLKEYRGALATLEEDPDDQKAQLRILNLVNYIGSLQRREGKEELARAAFRKAGSMARELLKDPEIAKKAPASFGHAFYNEACALALGGDKKGALAALGDAFSNGYEDVSHLTIDEDLVSLRDDAQFVAKSVEWTKQAELAAEEFIKHELASFESYRYDFAETDLDGNPIKFADLKGKVVIVGYWGTWCPPCRAEIPSFIALQEKYAKDGFQMIGINCNERAEEPGREAIIEKVKTFIAENKINYPCILDRAKKLPAKDKKPDAEKAKEDEKAEADEEEVESESRLVSLVPEFQGYPTTLFFDRGGKVRLQLVGLHSRQKLEAAVKLLLAEPKS